MNNLSSRSDSLRPYLDTKVFIISIIALFFVSGVLITLPEQTATAANSAKTWITTQFGWLYTHGCTATGFCWLACVWTLWTD